MEVSEGRKQGGMGASPVGSWFSLSMQKTLTYKLYVAFPEKSPFSNILSFLFYFMTSLSSLTSPPSVTRELGLCGPNPTFLPLLAVLGMRDP